MPQSANGRQVTARRVLVVDDNVDAATAVAELLRFSGHEVRVAHDGGFAIQSARAFRPEFIFLDLGLPGMDGFEVARSLKREPGLERTRIIALTGAGQEESRTRAHEAGFDQYIIKPIDPSFLDSLLG